MNTECNKRGRPAKINKIRANLLCNFKLTQAIPWPRSSLSQYTKSKKTRRKSGLFIYGDIFSAKLIVIW